MSLIYFISDVHLGFGTKEEEHTKEEKLLLLLNEIRQRGTHLFIVGDLFDFWFEYNSVIPKGYHRILSALDDLRRSGIEVDYLAGNHDFSIGNYFQNELQIRVWQNDLAVDVLGKKFYLFHGDGLANNDMGYRILKKILRNQLSQWCFRWLHPDIGVRVAHLTSRTSRDYTTQKNYGAADGMLLTAQKKIREGFDFVVMGHRHRPHIEKINSGTYINLGDWIHHFTYAVFDGSEMKLLSIKNNNRTVVSNS